MVISARSTLKSTPGMIRSLGARGLVQRNREEAPVLRFQRLSQNRTPDGNRLPAFAIRPVLGTHEVYGSAIGLMTLTTVDDDGPQEVAVILDCQRSIRRPIPSPPHLGLV